MLLGKCLRQRIVALFFYCVLCIHISENESVFVLVQDAIFRTLAAILHLGNIEFAPGKDTDSSKIKDSTSNFHLQMAAKLFMYVFFCINYHDIFGENIPFFHYCCFSGIMLSVLVFFLENVWFEMFWRRWSKWLK